MKLEQQLYHLGFASQQAKLYIAGLKLGRSLMAHLAAEAKVKRGTAYYIINELIRRKFFFVKKIGKRTYYEAVAPEKIVTMTEERLRFVKKIYPQLKIIQKHN